METFFTADTHFGHTRIIEFHPHRGSSIEEMNKRIVENWNAVVGAKDDVWFLGDFAMGKLDESLRYFHRLRGKKHLIIGNHDSPRTINLPWTSVDYYKEWKQKPYKAVLCHYPFLTWNGAHNGVYALHGHSHGMLAPTTTTRMDVGIDCHPEFRPFHLDEVVDYMSDKEYVVIDAHRPRH